MPRRRIALLQLAAALVTPAEAAARPSVPPGGSAKAPPAVSSCQMSRRAALVAAGGALLGGPAASIAAEAVAQPEAAAAQQYFRFASTSPVWTPQSAAIGREAQRTYNPKFVAYFARLLLNFDRASQSWWQDQTRQPFIASRALANDPELLRKQTAEFQRLQASISLGLRGFQSPEGVRRLFELLKDRFGGTEAGDRQLALLFSLMGEGQPTDAIAELVAQTDDARVARIVVDDPGSGYVLGSPPLVSVTAGAASGDDSARGIAVLGPTGRVLGLRVESGGAGYSRPPAVTIAPPFRGGRRALAEAVLRNGEVESVVLTDPGEGYSAIDEPLRVELRMVSPFEQQQEPEDYKLKRFQGKSQPGSNVGTSRYRTRGEDPFEAPPPPQVRGPQRGAFVRGVIDYGVSRIDVVASGKGYGLDLPVQVAISPPPKSPLGKGSSAVGISGKGVTAKASVELESALAFRRLTGWLPATSRTFAFIDLLPSTLVPQLDACLGRFTVSPVEEQDPNWCIYFDDEWAVVKNSKLTTYFNPLDGKTANSPIERERELPPSVYTRFGIGGAVAAIASSTLTLPLYTSKVMAQAEPTKYPEGLVGMQRMVEEGGWMALLVGLEMTIWGHLFYGAFSFGGTELFERLAREALGPSVAALYPVPILLGASSVAAILAAVVFSPFEALRIRIISSGQDPGLLTALKQGASGSAGVAALFEATVPLMLLEIPYAASRFLVFDIVARALTDALPPLDDAGALAVSLVAGALAGAAASLVTQPLDTVVVRQCEESPKDEAAGVVTPSGVSAGAAVASAAMSASVVSLGSSGGSGGGGSTAGIGEGVTVEEDAKLCVVPDAVGEPVGFFQVLMVILNEEGVGALFAGASTRAVYIAVLSSIQFFVYEYVKQVLHVSSYDLQLFFDVLSGLELSAGG